MEKVSAGEKKPFSCPYHCIKTCEKDDSPYCTVLALINAQHGSHGFAFAVENAHRAKEIISVSKLMAVPYDVPVIDNESETVNTLRLWKVEVEDVSKN